MEPLHDRVLIKPFDDEPVSSWACSKACMSVGQQQQQQQQDSCCML
jgi:hypothetical protein